MLKVKMQAAWTSETTLSEHYTVSQPRRPRNESCREKLKSRNLIQDNWPPVQESNLEPYRYEG